MRPDRRPGPATVCAAAWLLAIAILALFAPVLPLADPARIDLSARALPPGSAVRFRPVIGFRNRVVHLYDRVDPEIVFRVVKEDRRDLAELLGLLLLAAGVPA